MENMMIAGVGMTGLVACCCCFVYVCVLPGIYYSQSSANTNTNANNQPSGPCSSAEYKSFEDTVSIEPIAGKTAPSSCDAYKALIHVFGSTEKLLTESPTFRIVSGKVVFGSGDKSKADQPFLQNVYTKPDSTPPVLVVFGKEKYTFATFEGAVMSKVDPNDEKKENATTELNFTIRLKANKA